MVDEYRKHSQLDCLWIAGWVVRAVPGSGAAAYEYFDDDTTRHRRRVGRGFLLFPHPGSVSRAVLTGQPQLVRLDRRDSGCHSLGVDLSDDLPQKMVGLAALIFCTRKGGSKIIKSGQSADFKARVAQRQLRKACLSLASFKRAMMSGKSLWPVFDVGQRNTSRSSLVNFRQQNPVSAN